MKKERVKKIVKQEEGRGEKDKLCSSEQEVFAFSSASLTPLQATSEEQLFAHPSLDPLRRKSKE